MPIVAPPLAPLVDDDDAFFAVNGLLLRNPSIVNFLDGCALSLPCQHDDELPVGLMVWSAARRRRRGARRRPRDRSDARRRQRRRPVAHLRMQIAVIGAGVIGVTTAYELAADGHR